MKRASREYDYSQDGEYEAEVAAVKEREAEREIDRQRDDELIDYTVKEVAKRFGVTLDAVYKAHYRKHVGHKNRYNVLVFTPRDVEQYREMNQGGKVRKWNIAKGSKEFWNARIVMEWIM